MAKITDKIKSITPVSSDQSRMADVPLELEDIVPKKVNEAKPEKKRISVKPKTYAKPDLKDDDFGKAPSKSNDQSASNDLAHALKVSPMTGEAALFHTPRKSGALVFGLIAAGLWLGLFLCLAIFVLKFGSNWPRYSAGQWTALAGLLIMPLLLIGLCTVMLRSIARLADGGEHLARAADALGKPDTRLAERSETLASVIKSQVDDVNEKLHSGLGRLSAIEEVLGTHQKNLAALNLEAESTTAGITSAIEHQKLSMREITSELDTRMSALTDTLAIQTDALNKASKLAEQKINEARLSVEGATSKINNASDIVRSNTVHAASTLADSHAEIKDLGVSIGERSAELDSLFGTHSQSLRDLVELIRVEQQSLGANLEERLEKMRDLSLAAQTSAERLGEASRAGKDTVTALAQSAAIADEAVKSRFAELEKMVKYSAQHTQGINDLAAQRVHDSLELSRKAISRIEADLAGIQARAGTKELNRSPALDLIADPAPLSANLETQSEQEKKPVKRRWSRLRLKPAQSLPVDPDLAIPNVRDQLKVSPPAQEERAANPAKEDLAPQRPPKPIEQSVNGDTPSLLELRGPVTGVLDSGESGAPVLKITMPKDAPPAKADVQAETPQLRDSNSAPIAAAKDQDLVVSAAQAGQDFDTQTVDPDLLTTPVAQIAPFDDEDRPHKARRGLFGLFGKKNSDDDSDVSSDTDGGSMSIVKPVIAAPAKVDAEKSPAPPPPIDRRSKDLSARLLRMLTDLGFTPHILIDDQIVETAADKRIQAGHEDMSRGVTAAITDPISQLAHKMAGNDYLSDMAIAFATNFDQEAQAASADGSLKTLLATGDGRIYLLCDAALNYGRV